ncbi:MAG: class II aldolase/adducin family protein [Parcubacteria group bacterium]|nr:class II aldolase/adducin family protein [Parcubacteria group bacterium]
MHLTIANDLSEIRHDFHPITIVTAEGGAIRIEGTKKEVAEKLVAFVIKRTEVSWFKTEHETQCAGCGEIGHLPACETHVDEFDRALSFAQEAHLLYDTSGNVSMRSFFSDDLLITPRQVDKKQKDVIDNLCFVSVDQENKIVSCCGAMKSSVDSPVHDMVYKRYKHIQYLIHFHEPWGKFSNRTTFPYPCGAEEEGKEIVNILSQDENNTMSDFAIELMHHGALLGITTDGLDRLKREWKLCRKEYTQHLIDVRKFQILERATLKPIFHNAKIVGVIMEFDNGVAIYLLSSARGQGIGESVIAQIIQRQKKIKTIDQCEVLDFYTQRGFTVERKDGDMYTLSPPKISGSDELFGRIGEWKI